MRDLSELNITNDAGKPVDTPPPSPQEIAAFQRRFRVILPALYLRLLTTANGGHPEVDAFDYLTESGHAGGSAIDRFFNLGSDDEDQYGVSWNTKLIRDALGRDGLVAIGENGGGDAIFLDLSDDGQSVHILYRTSGNAVPKIADNFEDFINGLSVDPDFV